ncbi:DUF6355 family natural product biosynthesis protein [Allokutzneria oryzae]|uniref:DUF6355 family natural product biosynthesis protein n=1 Tax=Allokutzneria oryzae TaxID=1378989 RepID=A0ABV5ZTI3_9PSEU
MRKGMRTVVAIAGAVTALAAGTATAGAAPATEVAQVKASADPCGWFVSWGTGYYNHCGPTNVVIYVDRTNIGGFKDYEKCVPPGTTRLGPWPDWKGAWYLRPC